MLSGLFILFQERLELIGKQYEADRAKLEKIRLLLVLSSGMCHVMLRVHSV